MWEDSNWLYSEDRAIGQHLPKGYSQQGRFAFDTPYMSRSFFDNRAVGQHTMGMNPKDFFGQFDVAREPAYTTGWENYHEPQDNVTVPTMIYSGDEQIPVSPPPENILPFGLRARHVVILAAVAAVILIVLIKK